MLFMVGLGWSVILLLVAVICLVVAIVWLVYRVQNSGSWKEANKGWPIAFFVAFFVFLYLGMFSVLHVKVLINNQALLVNTISQEITGVESAGIHEKKLFTKVITWPANDRYYLQFSMQQGVESATCSDQTAVVIAVNFYLNLNKMDIEAIYKAINGDFTSFWNTVLRVAVLDIARDVSKNYTASEHTSKRDLWVIDFENELEKYLNERGYEITLIKGMTTESWDFASEEVSKAYDAANLAIYTQKEKENEKAALGIEQEMAVMRADMLISTTDGTISSLDKMATFFEDQDPEVRPFLVQYLGTLVDLEYLRLVGEQKPEQFLPPNSDTIPTYTTNQTNQNTDIVTNTETN
jgi:hypothetical protein